MEIEKLKKEAYIAYTKDGIQGVFDVAIKHKVKTWDECKRCECLVPVVNGDCLVCDNPVPKVERVIIDKSKTTAKEFMKAYIESFTEKQCEDLLFLVNLAQGNKDKADIMKFVGLYENTDSARPQAWSDKMRDEMRANPMWYVWCYIENRVSGKPEHLLEALVNKICVDLK